MSELEIRTQIRYVIAEMLDSDAFFQKMVKAMANAKANEKRLITAKEAAQRLNISMSLLYKMKTYPDGTPIFSVVKTGNAKSSTLRYNSATLVREYEAYLAWKRQDAGHAATREKGM